MLSMSRKNSNNKKQLIIVMSIVFLIGIIIVIVFLLNRNQDTFEYEGWIDCQPVLSESEADLCRRAKAAGYPYIAY